MAAPREVMIPVWLQAMLWGWLSGAALVIGAAIGYGMDVPRRIIAGVVAFGSGVLIATLSFELMEEAHTTGGFLSTGVGFLGGALIFTLANRIVSAYGAKHRKRSGEHQVSEEEASGSGMAIAIGALLDGIPESIVIGLSLLQGGAVSAVTVIAVFLSNLPEGLSSAAGMKKAERSMLYIFGVWGSIAFVSGVAAFVGYTVFDGFPPSVVAATTAVAAGAILAMLVDTMIPEAFAEAHDLAGLITALGFLTAFILCKVGA